MAGVYRGTIRPLAGWGSLRYGTDMPARRWGARRLHRVIALAIVLGLLVPSTISAAPNRATAPSFPRAHVRTTTAAVQPFTLDLSRPGDFVAQTNFVQCVGASMQMMLNMVEPTDDRSAARQLELQQLARAFSGSRPDGRERQGASIRGWMVGLNLEGAGPYRITGTTGLQDILRIAARAMRQTNRPVGLLVWRGRHAWVMAGFTATADPALTDEFEVTRVVILDPLYPHGSKVWGPSPKPGQSLAIEDLARQFVPRGNRGGGATDAVDPGTGSDANAADPTVAPALTWSQGLAGRYVVLLPYNAVTPVRAHLAVPR